MTFNALLLANEFLKLCFLRLKSSLPIFYSNLIISSRSRQMLPVSELALILSSKRVIILLSVDFSRNATVITIRVDSA